jgi:SAM-dependent methyltransferase
MGSRVIDVGTGTGALLTLLARSGCEAIGIDPDSKMLRYARENISIYPRCRAVRGSAEKMPVPSSSADLIVGCQSLLAFAPARARAEFKRVLRPSGRLAFFDFDWPRDGRPFMRDYRKWLAESLGARPGDAIHRAKAASQISRIFRGRRLAKRDLGVFETPMDWPTFWSRFLSAPYAPPIGSRESRTLRRGLKALFDQHAKRGRVDFALNCGVVYEIR